MKENKGITLVALIITIIVMLILVGVTISAVVQSDIIGQGEQAGNAYKEKQAEEQSLNPTYDNKTVKDYLDKVQTSTNSDPEPSGGSTTPIVFKKLYASWATSLTAGEKASIEAKLIELGAITAEDNIIIDGQTNIYEGDPTTGGKRRFKK